LYFVYKVNFTEGSIDWALGLCRHNKVRTLNHNRCE